MTKKEFWETHCRAPDRDVPGIKCGYPLPCPWHTVVVAIDAKGKRKKGRKP
jgi:hypothetical protein